MNHDELKNPVHSNLPLAQESLPSESDPLWRTLDDWQMPEPGQKFDADIMARIRQEKAAEQAKEIPTTSSWLDGWRWLFAGKAWVLSGSLAAALLAMVILWQPSEVPVSPDTETAMDVSAQQVEWALEDLEMLEELYGLEEGQSNAL